MRILVHPDEIVQYKVNIIKRAINESAKDTQFINLVKNKFINVPKENYLGALWQWQNSFKFIQEPPGVDYVTHAMEFVEKGQGDCDDFVAFNAATAKILGIPMRIKVTDTEGRGYYKHILLETRIRTRAGLPKWIPFDGTFRKNGMGGEPPIFNNKYRIFRL